MRLSPAAEFAVRGAVVLAEDYGRGLLTIDEICAKRGLQKEYLTKIFRQLANAHIVVPMRGKNGGYTLARDPSRITLLDVVQAVEGPLAVNLCQQDPPRCNQTSCVLHGVWADIQQTMVSRLSSVTLADCVNGASRDVVEGYEPARKTGS